ncbi:formate dehydrogenase subunit gamma [Jannaschia sp. W003]|uniref:formate dehydrogenase subunit gamma n=1 Tax=Jannaschia sp. W003 TaxID=2867012 RepID=UPI0021A55B2A|nr:formate dehydrogenase subunit gamma [Jannaschia sp. W003]UWQ21471.1 formate dehydrogenase subunit gamma [Jannaschia sp. W003]
MTRLLAHLLLCAALVLPGIAAAQTVRPPENATNGEVLPVPSPAPGADPSVAPPAPAREAVPAQGLDDILRRQQGLAVDDTARREGAGMSANPATGIENQLGTLGGASDPEMWRALRYGSADVTVSSGDPVGSVLMQDGGMRWLQFRQGPLREYGGWLLLGTLGLLLVFYLLRGRIRVDGGLSGVKILRFRFYERLAHWTMAASFIALSLTGLAVLFGRAVILPTFGPEANAALLVASKWVHNNVAWPFMISLVAVFFLWVWHNIPNMTDVRWVLKGGGFIGKAHPPAKKFNFGQKMVFWAVILFGASISASGLSLLFPFEFPMFAGTFAELNGLGLTEAVGLEPLPTALSPQEEMQYAQLWHAIIGFVFMAIVMAHIYIGTLGMQGAYDAMGTGEVDEAWAEQHHSIWLEKVRRGEAPNPHPELRGGDARHPAE